MTVRYNKNTGRLEVPPGHAVRLQRIGFKPDARSRILDRAVPERATHVFALHPDYWEATFWALTNKDRHKIVHYRPAAIPIVPGTLVADMRYASQFLWGDDAGMAPYVASVRPIECADLTSYHLPELLIPQAHR